MLCENFASLRLPHPQTSFPKFCSITENYQESGLKLVIYKLFFIHLEKNKSDRFLNFIRPIYTNMVV